MSGPNLLIVGEALVDIVPDAAGPGGTRDLPGGSPANVAITLGRLGNTPTLVTALADDERGAAVRAWLEASGVEVVAGSPASGRTSTATVVLDESGSATYVFALDWDPPAETLLAAAGNADVLHTGSIATVLPPGASTVEAALHAARGRALITFDPNARPTITPDVAMARAQVERLVALADVVKVSEEDLAWYYPGLNPVTAARRWVSVPDGAGPALVVVTLGGDGALAVRSDAVGEPVRVAGVKVTVADTIGAGDTFMGALIDALITLGATGPQASDVLAGLTDTQLADAISWAARAAAITVSRPGADPPTRTELTADQ